MCNVNQSRKVRWDCSEIVDFVQLARAFGDFSVKMESTVESSKLLRSRRSSDSRKKRKKKEKAVKTKWRRSHTARLAAAVEIRPKEVVQKPLIQEGDQLQEDKKDIAKGKATDSVNETAERYHKHALYFYSKWTEAERGNLPVIEESSLKEQHTEIGRGCFGVCTFGKFGARTVVVKQQDDHNTAKHEARMTAKLSHPNVTHV